MTKIKNRIFAIPAEAPAIPPNPKAAALPPFSHRVWLCRDFPL